MALIKCSECGKEISDKASSCPGCGAPVVTQEKIEMKIKKEKQEIKQIIKEDQRKENNKKSIIIIACVVLAVISIFYINSNVLFGNDKIAYNIFQDGAKQFKNPDSVKILEGRLSSDERKLYLKISAENGFGGTDTAEYVFSNNGLYAISVSVEKYYKDNSTGRTNFDFSEGTKVNHNKINKKYSK